MANLFNCIQWGTGFKKTGLDVDYKIYMQGKQLIIVFQPTWSIQDAVLDFSAVPRWVKNIGFVYNGMWEGYNSAREKILSEIDKAIVENIKNIHEICVYGYSMGGAYAVLTYLELDTNSVIPSKCVTWGMPAIFFMPSNKLKCALKNVIRVVYEKDLFTVIPLFFTHIGKLVKIGKCDKLWNIKSHEMYYQCSDELI